MKSFFALLFCSILGWSAFAYDVPPLTGPIVDTAHMLSSEGSIKIEEAIREIYKQKNAQIQVVTLPSLNGETIEQVGIQFADKWKIGDAKENGQRKDNGLIIIVAVQDRKMRLEVGRGLEGDIPDAIASRIINDVMVPYFKKGSPEEGVLAGVLSIHRILAGEDLKLSDTNDRRSPASYFVLIKLLFFLFILFVWPLFAGRRRRYYGGGGFYVGGGGGFGGGSGGGWSGGGGGFSGGGASGGW